MKLKKKDARKKRHYRIRKIIKGTLQCPRMSVYSSNLHMYIQFIDDFKQKTLASISTLSPEFKKTNKKSNIIGAQLLGEKAAKKIIKLGIKQVIFDRGGFKYHGKIKAIAESARKNGLVF